MGALFGAAVYAGNAVEAINITSNLKLGLLVSEAAIGGLFSGAALRKLQQVAEDLFRSPSDQKSAGPSAPILPDQSSEDLHLEAELEMQWNRDRRNAARARQLIEVRSRMRKYEEAADVYDVLIGYDPENADLIQDKAELYLKIPDRRRYVEILEQAERIRAERSFKDNIGRPIVLSEMETRDLQFFADFKWTFQPVNVLLGKNGYGKSHLLRALVAMLQTEKEVTAEFFPQSGLQAMIRVDIKKEDKTESTVRNRLVFDKSFGKVPVLAIPDMRYMDKSITVLGPSAATDLRRQSADHFMYETPYQGVIVNFIYDLCLDYKDPKDFDKPIFSLMQRSVQELTSSTFKFVDIIRKDNAQFEVLVLTEGNENKPLPLQKVSQGTLSVLAMVGLIYRFLKAIYPQVQERELTKQRAIVVIDEIDAHLHPVWQQKVLQLFRDMFPNVQFIVTAHTPLVVAGCKEREVAVLRRAGDRFMVEVLEDHFIGATATSIYERVFQVEDKDLTYLRLNTLSGTKGETEKKLADLESRTKLSLEQEAELVDLRNKLHYLSVANDVAEQRGKDANSASQRQLLEMEVMNLRGEVSKLQSRLESGQQLAQSRDVSGLVNFVRQFAKENPQSSGLFEPFIRQLSRNGGFAEAASLLEVLLESHADNVNYFKSLAVQYQSMNDSAKAMAILREAASAFPKDEEVRRALASLEKNQREEHAC